MPRVCLATMSRDSILLECHMGITASLMSGLLSLHLVVGSGPYLDAGRNKAIANGLAQRDTHPWDWFLFVDSDIEFTPDHLRALFAPTLDHRYDPTAYPVLGGVYVNPFNDNGVPGDEVIEGSGFFGPVVYEYVEVDDLPGELNGKPTLNLRRLSRASLATRAPVDEWWNPNGDVTEVDAIGTGFLAIHISLIEDMGRHYGEPLPWFDEPVRNGVHFGEDMGFALRCMDLGYPVLANRACTPIHHKTTKLV